mgnify:CR=1 FL=1
MRQPIFWCDAADVFYMDEEQMQKNYLNQKAAYQKIINGSVDEKI